MGQGKKLKDLLTYKDIKTKSLAEAINVAPTTLYSIIQRDNDIKSELQDVIVSYFKINPVAFRHFLSGDITIENLLSVDPSAENLYVYANEDNSSWIRIEARDPSVNSGSEALLNTLNNNYNRLNYSGKLEAVKRVEELTYIEKYTQKD